MEVDARIYKCFALHDSEQMTSKYGYEQNFFRNTRFGLGIYFKMVFARIVATFLIFFYIRQARNLIEFLLQLICITIYNKIITKYILIKRCVKFVLYSALRPRKINFKKYILHRATLYPAR
jgi:hypothetical protein